ncbi:MAG: exonuclease SbcCD subunit D [Actinomycetota bacterium]|nr:exonuclease SbcCD subunit D [Actinomycetota bacterium]
MRVLHTSDWHVGRSIRGRSRAEEHRAVLAEIAQLVLAEEADVVLVAGDLFDTSAPAPESERIVYRALLDLAATGAQVVVIAGNHDNPQRLAAVKPLLGLTAIHAGANLARPSDGGVLTLRTRAGETAQVALLPFLSQRAIVKADDLMRLDPDAHAGRYAERVRQIVDALTAGFEMATVNLVVAHLAVVGDTLGGGERPAHTVFDYVVPPQVFPPTAHYVALGHLHRPQLVPAACPIWYCGSPLQLDFGEAPGDNCVLLVDAEPGTPARIRPIPLRAGRRLKTLRGTLAEVAAQRDDVGDDFLRVVLQEPARAGLADEVRALLPNTVDVTVAAAPPEGDGDDEWSLASMQRSPHELFGEYLRDNGSDDPAVGALFAELLEEAHAPHTA